MNAKKFKNDVIWNFASIAILGISGLGLNILIGLFYNAEALGIFNQSLSIYIVFSQLGTLGINLALLKSIPEQTDNMERIRSIVSTSTAIVALSSIIFTLIFWICSPLISSLMDSPGVLVGLRWITPGLLFFCVNKVFFAVLNGLKYMRAFSIFNSIRYLNLLVGFGLAMFLEMSGEKLAYVFSFSESFLFICLVIYLRKYFSLSFKGFYKHAKSHLNFGFKSMFSAAFLELNSRVDVLMVGFFLSDKATGIYSFAAMFFEGFMQFLIVLQTNYNPYIRKLIYDKKNDELVAMFKKGRNKIYKYGVLLIPIIIIVFPFVVNIITNKPEFSQAAIPFTILMIGLFLVSGYYPFNNILMLGDRPAQQTLFIFLVVTSNFIYNLIFIPILGISGAALGSALAMVSGVLYLIILSKKIINIKLY